jgi:ribosomal protein L39E
MKFERFESPYPVFQHVRTGRTVHVRPSPMHAGWWLLAPNPGFTVYQKVRTRVLRKDWRRIK